MRIKNFQFGHNQLIAGIGILIIVVTALAMIRISYNESIVDSYNAITNPLPAGSKIGALDRFWQSYTGGTRNTSVNFRDASRAQDAIDNTYNFMIVADVILIIALGGAVYMKLKRK